MLKKDELLSTSSCLNKADPLEPIFVLRAKDRFAAQAVRLWAAMAVEGHEEDKLAEAHDLAARMDEWRANWMAEDKAAVPTQDHGRLRERVANSVTGGGTGFSRER
jgi:hypothetical protein